MPRDNPPHVCWVSGPAGCGKSRFGATLFKRELTFFSWSSTWFDGLSQTHVCVVLDDLRADKLVPPSFFLRMLDRYPVRLAVKGSSIELRAAVIVVTSCKTPAQFWADCCTLHGVTEDLEQLQRRINTVLQMPCSQHEQAQAAYKCRKAAFDARTASAPEDTGYDLTAPPPMPLAPVFGDVLVV